MNDMTVSKGISSRPTSVARGQVSDDELRAFAVVLRAYLGHENKDRDGIARMASIVTDPDATVDEVEDALETMREGLYPTDFVDLETSQTQDAEEQSVSRRMDLEEETFATRLHDLMSKRGISQVDLAAMIGVGQPAICMMLSRNCRPQRRTIERLSQALRVSPTDLWPSYINHSAPSAKPVTADPSLAVTLIEVKGFEFTMPTSGLSDEVNFAKTRAYADELLCGEFPFKTDPNGPRAAA